MKPPDLNSVPGGWQVRGEDFEIVFSAEAGVFPAAAGFLGGVEPMVQNGDWSLEWEENGNVYTPASSECTQALQLTQSVVLNFDRVPFSQSDGTTHPDLTLSLEYEIFSDGVGFCTFFLRGESLEGAEVDRLSLRMGFSPRREWNTDWSYWQLPEKIEGSFIQSPALFGRKIPVAESREFSGEILPFVSFDSGLEWRRTDHVEFFLESANGLSNTMEGVSTRVGSLEGKPGITWNLQDRPWCRTRGRSIFYRNVLGFCLVRAPRFLKRAPLRIYHYFDNFRRYPDESIVADARSAGADTFILHENWRLDERNSEIPFDRAALCSTIETCHRHGLRVGLYLRGNEDGVRERHAEFLAPLLQKNWDGLYLDWGSPVVYLNHEEFAPGGRVHFRDYHRMLRGLREVVGEEGFLLSHSGSFFSALAHASLDGYFGGEQEQGKLLDSREHHAYFSGIGVSPGYWWTAAFPIYRSARAVAMMAATLHAPVVLLGVQCPYSALNQPPTPEANGFARMLWVMWGLLDGHGTLQVNDTHRSPEVFEGHPDAVAPAALWDSDGEGIITAASLSDQPVSASFTIRENTWADAGDRFFIPLRWGQGHAEVHPAQAFAGGRVPEFQLDPYEVAGWLVTADPSRWRERLEKVGQEPTWLSRETRVWESFVKGQRRWREEAPVWKECHLSVSAPNWPNAYEDSVWVDLFDNDLILEALDKDGNARRLGVLDRDGLHDKPGPRENRLAGGEHSPWVDLGSALNSVPDGFDADRIRLLSRKGEIPFYLFVRIHLSPEPALSDLSRTLEFCVDLDDDWSALVFPALAGNNS